MGRKQVALFAVLAVLCLWRSLSAGELKPGTVVRGKVYIRPSPYVWHKSPDGITVPAEIKWPAAVLRTFSIPVAARDVWYASSDGQFMVYYEADICYPAIETIKAMASLMRSQGWEHMTVDPLNRRSRLPPEYPDNDQDWGGWYPWQSYWRDASGDVVQYDYSYYVDIDIPPNSLPGVFANAVKRSCSLTVGIAYYLPDAFNLVVKAVEQVREKVEKREKERTEKLGKVPDTSK
jgi:hypothetical protein